MKMLGLQMQRKAYSLIMTFYLVHDINATTLLVYLKLVLVYATRPQG